MATPTGLAVNANRIVFSNDAGGSSGGQLNIPTRVGEVTAIDLTSTGSTLLWTSLVPSTITEATVLIEPGLSGFVSAPTA